MKHPKKLSPNRPNPEIRPAEDLEKQKSWQPTTSKIYHLYILPSGGLYATYHLLGEPETTIEKL